MLNRKINLFTLFIWLCLGTGAQQLSFIKYTVYDGLVANPVRCIYQDSKGFIWIGTFEGLSRYDGYKFRNYTTTNGLSHDLVNDIYEVNGKLLIAENDGSVDFIQNGTIQKKFKAASAINSIRSWQDRIPMPTDENGFYEYKNDSIILPTQTQNPTSLAHALPLNDSLIISDAGDYHLIIYKTDLTIHVSNG
jgi:hypothetical protein